MPSPMRLSIVCAAAFLTGCVGATTSSYTGAIAESAVPVESLDLTARAAPSDIYEIASPEADAYGSPYDAIYAASYDEGHEIAAFDWRSADPRYLRQTVAWYGAEAPGTIVIDVDNRHLYLVESGGRATRYGIAVGKEGFGWTGMTTLARKASWPRWFPPAAMIERKPELEEYREGMDGGPSNPIGARALYLHKGGRDTLYRIHGTDKPWSIGRAASSGCFRMINQDVIDLHARVPTGGQVIVRNSAAHLASL